MPAEAPVTSAVRVVVVRVSESSLILRLLLEISTILLPVEVLPEFPPHLLVLGPWNHPGRLVLP